MLKVRIETKNDAFVGYGHRDETIRCLQDVIEKIRHYEYEGNIHDTNGGLVGNFTLTNR